MCPGVHGKSSIEFVQNGSSIRQMSFHDCRIDVHEMPGERPEVGHGGLAHLEGFRSPHQIAGGPPLPCTEQLIDQPSFDGGRTMATIVRGHVKEEVQPVHFSEGYNVGSEEVP